MMSQGLPCQPREPNSSQDVIKVKRVWKGQMADKSTDKETEPMLALLDCVALTRDMPWRRGALPVKWAGWIQ